MMMIVELFLIISGTIFILIASIGILRMPDLLMRMHAATKAGTLGIGLILWAVIIHFSKFNVTIEALTTMFFVAVTAPISSHLIARASYFNQIKLSEKTFIDELKPNYDPKTHTLS